MNELVLPIFKVTPGLVVAGVGWAGQRYYELPTREDLKLVSEHALTSVEQTMAADDRSYVLTHYLALLPEAIPLHGDKTGIMWDCVRDLVHALRPITVIQGHAHGLLMAQAKYVYPGRKALVAFPGSDGGVLTVDVGAAAVTFQPWL